MLYVIVIVVNLSNFSIACLSAGSDLILPSSRWSSSVVGICSEWLDLDAQSDPRLRLDSEAALQQETAWASHLNVPAVMLPPPGADPMNYAMQVNQIAHRGGVHLWVPLPMAASVSSAEASSASSTTHASAASSSDLIGDVMLLSDHDGHQHKQQEGSTSNGHHASSSSTSSSSSAPPPCDPWHTWNTIRCLADHTSGLSLCLLMTKAIPSPSHIQRWLGEPVKCCIIPTALFLANKAGYPTLSKAHQSLFLELHRRRVQFILRGPASLPASSAAAATASSASSAAAIEPTTGIGAWTPATSSSSSSSSSSPLPHPHAAYLAYLTHLVTKHAATIPPAVLQIDRFCAPFNDVLQAPLQPLQDNLEAATYEVFESDPVKYQGYEDAVAAALEDLAREGRLQCQAQAGRQHADAATADDGMDGLQPTPHKRARPSGESADSVQQQPLSSSSPSTPSLVAVVMVVGAGRGPIVRRVLAAADRVWIPVRVYAVEKNPNAVITLRSIAGSDAAWKGRVTVVQEDMRRWDAPEMADVLVSELLGSFSDNELSPECLDGAQRLLSRPHGVCIPQSYTSHIHPIMSQRLWNGVGAMAAADPCSLVRTNGGSGFVSKWFETPFVVRLHNVYAIDAPQPVFTFSHPNYGGTQQTQQSLDQQQEPGPDNRRYASLRFTAQSDALVHGFGGYFTSTLYRHVSISTHPACHSPGMFSWFPIFFPVRTPVRVMEGQGLGLRMWRCVGGSGGGGGGSGRVWYEWAAAIVPETAAGGGAGSAAAPGAVAAAAFSAIHNPGGRSYAIGL